MRERAWIVCALLLLAAAPAGAATHLLLVVGLGGDVENAARFHEWAAALVDAARSTGRLPRENVVYLGEDVARDPQRIDGRSTREGIASAIDRLSTRIRPGDIVLVVLIGHGAAAAGGAKFNLPGRDLDVSEWARLLDRLAPHTVAFVNTASASGAFLGPLAARNRVVITATRSDGERNQTRFPAFFVQALTSADADRDKDGRVSLLEAFAWARQRTAAAYEQEGQILTEHAVLDDDGDGKGSDPGGGAESADGALARTVFLASGEAAAGPPADADPALRALYDERRVLEDRVGRLKAGRDQMDPSQYQQELERLLLELAKKTREIREKEKG